MKWCIKIRDNSHFAQNNRRALENLVYRIYWKSIQHFTIFAYMQYIHSTSLPIESGLLIFLFWAENQSSNESGLESTDMHLDAMNEFSEARNDLSGCCCCFLVFSLLRMHSFIIRAEWKKRLKLKTFWIFYKHFSFILANDFCFFFIVFICVSQCDAEKIRKYFYFTLISVFETEQQY